MAKRKVKVVKAPNSKKHMGDQMGYGLYRGQSIRDFNAFTETDPHSDMRNVFPESPRSEANIEVEKGEKVIAKDGMSIYDVGGKKHSQGGTPIKAEPGSYVVSDFIKASKLMQAKMGFEVKSSKGKDNTWARVLESKVSTKDYNKLAEFLRQAAAGGDIDRYELATAKNKMAVYQDYVSKAALGNELTKMMQGKEYKIPEIGMPALQKMFPEMAQQMMGGNQQNNREEMAEGRQGQNPQEEQQEMMGYGGTYYNLPKAEVGQDIRPWMKGKTQAGSYTPTGRPNSYNRGDSYLDNWAAVLGIDINVLKKMSNRDVQALIYDYSLQNNPEEIEKMWQTYGLTNQGKKYKDLIGMTSKDSKGRPTYRFDKGISPQDLIALKKAYTDNLFGRRQLDPKGKLTITPPGTEDFPQDQDSKYMCDPTRGVLAVRPGSEMSGVTYYDSYEEAEAVCSKKPNKEIPGLKYACNPSGTGVMAIDPNTPMAPGAAVYNTREEALASCKREEVVTTTTKQPGSDISYGGDQGEIPRLPYEQDVINLGTSLVNKYGYRDVYPYRKRSNAIGWDPSFYSTAAQEALLNSQAKTAMEDASLYAGSPQVQAARMQQTQAATIPALMQARMQTNQANIGVDNQARMSNAAIYNQAGQQDAFMSNQLSDMNAKFIHNKDVSRARSNVDVANQQNDLLTHSGDTALMNQWYPQEAFNPLTYRTMFHNGKGIRDEAAATASDVYSDYDAAYARMSQHFTNPKDIHDAAINILEYQRGKPTATRRKKTGAYTTDDDQTDATTAVSKYGGPFIPMYLIGGNW